MPNVFFPHVNIRIVLNFTPFCGGGLGCVLIQKPLQVKVKSGSVNFAFNITLDMISIIKLCTN